jgi:hypothetical protein
MGEVDVADVAMCVGDEFALLQCDNVQVGRRLRELLRAKTREQLIFGMGYCLPPIVNLIRDPREQVAKRSEQSPDGLTSVVPDEVNCPEMIEWMRMTSQRHSLVKLDVAAAG